MRNTVSTSTLSGMATIRNSDVAGDKFSAPPSTKLKSKSYKNKITIIMMCRATQSVPGGGSICFVQNFLSVVCLFNDSLTVSDYTPWKSKTIKGKWFGQHFVSYYNYVGIFMQELSNTTKPLSQYEYAVPWPGYENGTSQIPSRVLTV